MNNFAKAHEMTRSIIQAGDNYAATFALCLKHIYKEAKAMPAKKTPLETRIANEKSIVRKAVRNAIQLGYAVSLYDGEEWTVKRSRKESEVMEAAYTTDCDTLSFAKQNESGEWVRAGSVFFVYGNCASEVMNDWTDSDEVNNILKPAIEKADKLSEQGL